MKFPRKFSSETPRNFAPLDIIHSYQNTHQTHAFLSNFLYKLNYLFNPVKKVLLVQRNDTLKKQIPRQTGRTGSSRPKQTPNTNSIPIIKSTAHKKNNQFSINNNLNKQSVLCVGGLKKFYLQYHQLTSNLNGSLVTFHGGIHDCLSKLHPLLETTDLIICPVDCINHECFFIVKYYCKYSGKPCVLLDHAWPTTFQAGLKMLANMSISSANNT